MLKDIFPPHSDSVGYNYNPLCSGSGIEHVVGLTLEQLHTKRTFTQVYWDFDSIWYILPDDCPRLRAIKPADISGDNIVDHEDLALLATEWLSTTLMYADIAGGASAGIVDLADFALLQAFWAFSW